MSGNPADEEARSDWLAERPWLEYPDFVDDIDHDPGSDEAYAEWEGGVIEVSDEAWEALNEALERPPRVLPKLAKMLAEHPPPGFTEP